jgi:ParB/RepB/Spo0J family partition protein
MSAQRGQWISRRGQSQAEAAIGQILDQQPGEQVQHVLDTLIEDSPYQARRPFSDESIADLVQGMRAMGFQGVLIVRPHSDPSKRRSGTFQLVYGHRRRTAWQRVCTERGEHCLVPVVVRDISDERMLTIGAQENLQRQDLDSIEEAQVVAWHQHMFSDKNQAQIGAMLGKSSDWVSIRARIHKLPDELKERLRQRPRAISQMLELSVLYVRQPDAALEIADRVVRENLTLETIRAHVRGYVRPEHRDSPGREEAHNRRGAATSVKNNTKPARHELASDIRDDQADLPHSPKDVPLPDHPTHATQLSIAPAEPQPHIEARTDPQAETTDPTDDTDLLLLQEATAALESVASRASGLPVSLSTDQALAQAERALMHIRSNVTHAALAQVRLVKPARYQLIDTNIHQLLITLLGYHPVVTSIQRVGADSTTLRLIMCLMPHNGAIPAHPSASAHDLFIAISSAGHGIVPLIEGLPAERARNSLSLTAEAATTIAAFVSDLARLQAGAHLHA